MIKDSKGNIWSGGYYNLKCFDLETNEVRLYPGVSSVTSIVEHDKDHMWIGTASGLYLLDRNSGKYQYVGSELEGVYINSLYQAMMDCYILARMEQEYLYTIYRNSLLSTIIQTIPH